MKTRVFITGGASGLGRALAMRYARDGALVCIGDINDPRGEATRRELDALSPGARYLRTDVTHEAELQKVADELQRDWGGLDVLVNNAGVAQAGAIEQTPLTDWEWLLDINLLGVVRGCRVFTPIFKQQRSGCIINIASMAGLLDVPFMASYNVSKAGVIALSGTLAQELMQDGVRVTVACPSFFKTNLNETFRTADPETRKTMERLLESGRLTAEQVADKIVDGAARGDAYILPHLDGSLAWLGKRLLPTRVYRQLFQRGVLKMLRPGQPR